jgi:hypothetical protein
MSSVSLEHDVLSSIAPPLIVPTDSYDDCIGFEDILNKARSQIHGSKSLEDQIDAMFAASVAILGLTEKRSNAFCISSHT